MRIKAESIAFVLIASILLTCSACGAAQVASTTIPVCFIQNNGQINEQVLYFADGAGYSLYLTGSGEVISTADPATIVQVVYQDRNPLVSVSGQDELQGKANFLIGNDESSWVTNVPIFTTVKYEDLYHGVDLTYHGGVNSLKSEYTIAPGVDPSIIRTTYTGQDGLSLDESGNLVISTAAGTFLETAPYCYQIVDEQQVVVPCNFMINDGGFVTFKLGAFDTDRPLVIDPVYNFSTYLGGTQDDKGSGIGIDDMGNVYVVGSTQSTEFPLSSYPAYQEHLNGSWDIFASKFSPDGSKLWYSTYIGGKKEDLAGGMVVNNQTGEVTFTGSTKSTDYPNSYPAMPYGGNTDAIVTRLNAAGNALIWSRLINGNKTDVGTAVTLDDYSFNDAVVTGYTTSPNLTAIGWVTTGQMSLAGATDGFVLVITPGGTLSRGTYLGSPSYDYAYSIAVDPRNGYDTWVTGSTNSYNSFPTSPSAFRKQSRGGIDVFITRLNWGDLSVGASTYLGGSSNDVGMGIDYDMNGYPYVTGYTGSPISPISLFPVTPNPQGFQTSFGGGQWDAFVTKMERDLSSMNYSTYLGGSDDDKAYGIAVDANGSAYVTGWTMSTNFPTKYPTQPTKGLGFRIPDAFITQMNQTGSGLVFSTYLGGTYYDEGDAIAITDDGKNITVTGYTESINFPIKNAYQPYLAGFPAVRFTDAFVTKYVKIPPVANFTGTPQTGCSPLTVHFTDTSSNSPTSWFWDFGDGTNSTIQNPNHTYVNPSLNTIQNFTVNLTACNIDGCGFITKNNFTTVCPNLYYDFTINQSARGCVGTNDTLIFNSTYISGSPISDWWFDFGDNTSVPHQVNVHQYNTTGLFNVTFYVQSECCVNSSVHTVDIRAKPQADFYAIPTSGLIPLDVQFFDNSTGRPSSWTWTFGAGEGGSNDQNPQYTYNNRGSFRVRLHACNFCGCDWENKTKYINAGVPNLSFAPGNLVVPTNDTTPIELYLEMAENGLSGYNIDIFWADSVHGNINAVHFPTWAMNGTNTSLPDYTVGITAVDLMNQVHPGATNVRLATFDLEGNISTFMSTIDINTSVNELDDDFGNPIATNSVPATITVVRLLAFPNKNQTPTDPDPLEPQVYWDVNGNGCVDFNDVITYFQNMQWIRDNQYKPFFDYNGNGYIDFADLILLFHKVPYCPP